MHYRFHPLAGQRVTFRRSLHGHPVPEVVDPRGTRYRIAEWMTSPEAGRHELRAAPRLSLDALADLHDPVMSFLDSVRKPEEDRDEEQTHPGAGVPGGPVPGNAAGLAESGAEAGPAAGACGAGRAGDGLDAGDGR